MCLLQARPNVARWNGTSPVAGYIHTIVYGEDGFAVCAQLCLPKAPESLRSFKIYLLDIDGDQCLMEEMTMLPHVMNLHLVVIANGHAFGGSLFHVLRLCTVLVVYCSLRPGDFLMDLGLRPSALEQQARFWRLPAMMYVLSIYFQIAATVTVRWKTKYRIANRNESKRPLNWRRRCYQILQISLSTMDLAWHIYGLPGMIPSPWSRCTFIPAITSGIISNCFTCLTM
ncbi:unnamed protein product [Urochloa humidicola]